MAMNRLDDGPPVNIMIITVSKFAFTAEIACLNGVAMSLCGDGGC